MKKIEMRSNETEGFLITFCGLDGCGKSTMINRLISDFSNDNNLFLTKQPTDFVRSSKIFRTYMDTPDHNEFDYRSLSLLAASDRLQHVNKVIEPAMKNGKIVISDRYFYSCLANLRARGFTNDDWIYEISKYVIKPDIAFFFDAPVTTCISRVRAREAEKNRYIDVNLQYKLRNEYLEICNANNCVLVPTAIDEDRSYKIVKNQVERIIKNGNRKDRY